MAQKNFADVNDLTRFKQNLCKLTVTYDTSLVGAKITVTDNDSISYSETATAAGSSVFYLEHLGEWDISEDKLQSSNSVTCEYYGEYSSMIGGKVFITVSYDSVFVGETVTLKNASGTKTYTKLATAGGSLMFVVKEHEVWTASIPYNGNTYDGSINATEDGEYTIAISEGDVTINVNYSNDFVGSTVILTNGTKQFQKIASTAGETLSFIVADYGNWTVKASISGVEYTTTVNVTGAGTYTATLSRGAGLATWLSKGGVTGSYATLDDVLADEKAVRQLMTKHDAVDYLLEWVETEPEAVQTIIRNDICAKWINLRDYALDTLYSNSTIKDMMDNSVEHGLVETLSSDIGKNGFVICDSITGTNYGYKAFDNDDSTFWASAGGSTGYLGYAFIEPVTVNSIYRDGIITDGNVGAWKYKVQFSDNGTTWSDDSTETTFTSAKQTITVNETEAHKYWRLLYSGTTSGSTTWNTTTLQFNGYGSDKDFSLVPTMTSNTTPSGEAISDSIYDSSTQPWKAMNGVLDGSSYWESDYNAYPHWIGYKSTSATVVTGIRFGTQGCGSYSTGIMVKNYKVQGSNNGTDWTDIYTGQCPNTGNANPYVEQKTFDNTTSYKYHRLYIEDRWDTSSYNYCIVNSLQFFGPEQALQALVPTMTSNTTPSGEAIGTESESVWPWWKGFDNNTSTCWSSKNMGSTSGMWLGYDFKRPVVVKSVMFNTLLNQAFIQTYKIQAYNGSDWIDLTDVLTSPKDSDDHVIDIDNDKAYNKYRFYVVTNHQTYNATLSKLQFYGFDQPTHPNTKYFLGEWSLVDESLIPKMTSNTSPSGTASCSSYYNNNNSYNAWCAFDGEDLFSGATYHTHWGWATTDTNPWVQYMFPNAVYANVLEFSTANPDRISGITVVGSNDGSTWIEVFKTPEDFTFEIALNKIYYFNLDNPGTYKYWRCYPDNMGSKGGSVSIFQLHNKRWQPKGNVPIMTSNTTPYGECFAKTEYSKDHEAYLAFTETGGTYSSSSKNAGEYLGYSFVNPVCVKRIYLRGYGPTSIEWGLPANLSIQGSNDGTTWENVKSYTGIDWSSMPKNSIGQPYMLSTFNNDKYYLKYRIYWDSAPADGYWACCNKLQFYGRELSVSVPKMESNNSPWGEVSCSSNEGDLYLPYHAFDGVVTDGLNTNTWVSRGNSNQWIQYDFSNPVKVNIITLKNASYPSWGNAINVNQFKIMASNDNETFIEIKDKNGAITQSNPSTMALQTTYMFESENAYRYWRLFAINNHGDNSYIAIRELQFYGLDYSEHLDINIKSAANDTIYSGSTVLCTTDATGNAVMDGFDLVELLGSNFTLSSSVAKDLSDNTKQYSKSITMGIIDDIYLMPDNTAYWYGNNVCGATYTYAPSKHGSGWAIPPAGSVTMNTNDITLSVTGFSQTAGSASAAGIIISKGFDVSDFDSVIFKGTQSLITSNFKTLGVQQKNVPINNPATPYDGTFVNVGYISEAVEVFDLNCDISAYSGIQYYMLYHIVYTASPVVKLQAIVFS